jgi:hypothetical protein
MSLWQDYQKNRQDEVFIDGLTDSMRPAIFSWLMDIARHRISDPYRLAVEVKNMFRIDLSIPRTRPNNYLTAEPSYRFAQFLLNVADIDSRLFFTIIDYLVQNLLTRDTYPEKLEEILAQAGHKYAIHTIAGQKVLAERLPEEKLMGHLLESSEIYASEFHDAFVELYGTNPDPTKATGEAFQALESALKFYLGEDKGDNLGAILGWLTNHRSEWSYATPSEGQDDAEEQFLSSVNFVNKSYRKTKHGQAKAKLKIERKHAEVILRSVALLVYQLENQVGLIKAEP